VRSATQEHAGTERPAARPPGRPPRTSARAIELIALELFTQQGFEHTTIDQIAAAAGVSRRTFFRYFRSKAEALWGQFDTEVDTIRAMLANTSDRLSVMTAVRHAVVAANRYRSEDLPELRTRMALISVEPELAATAAVHYEAWERAVADYVARRCSTAPDSLYPLAVSRATLATCRAAYDVWMARADIDLTDYLDDGLRAMAAGFSDRVVLGGKSARHGMRVR
jgi:mycofactocin system transcriptional regulator